VAFAAHALNNFLTVTNATTELLWHRAQARTARPRKRRRLDPCPRSPHVARRHQGQGKQRWSTPATCVT
jgi:hypothetical protein